MPLKEYNRKRKFARTREPRGRRAQAKTHRFVVHEHHASRLHFDFRLEMAVPARGRLASVLKSWAVPKGPSLDPRDKRLAVEVEDHPVSYIGFEGEIAEGNYGAGKVRIWDKGTYDLVEPFDPLEQLDSGKLSFVLHGKKLAGEFTLVKIANRDKQWLLIKKQDERAKEGWKLELVLGGDERRMTDEGRGKKKSEKQIERSERTTNNGRVKKKSAPERENAAAEFELGEIAERAGETLRRKIGGRALTIRRVEHARMPGVIEPMRATLVDKPFNSPEWIFETKYDGVRAVCFIENGKARLVSRSQQEITFRYPELENIAKQVRAARAILDGEIVVLDPKGVARFQLLQQRIGVVEEKDIRERLANAPVIYFVFDLLHYEDLNLMPAALVERKKLLKAILKPNAHLKFSAHTARDGLKAFRGAQKKQLEGIIAKHRDSRYVQRRSSQWLKIKTQLRQEVVIGGYTEPKGSREYFGALAVGLYRGNALVYVGNVGTGFNRRSLKQLYDMMQKNKTKKSPFAEGMQPNQHIQWLEPRLVCEVKFAEWTSGMQMRIPIFMGLRDDKDPKQCKLEVKKSAKKEVEKAEKTDQ